LDYVYEVREADFNHESGASYGFNETGDVYNQRSRMNIATELFCLSCEKLAEAQLLSKTILCLSL